MWKDNFGKCHKYVKNVEKQFLKQKMLNFEKNSLKLPQIWKRNFIKSHKCVNNYKTQVYLMWKGIFLRSNPCVQNCVKNGLKVTIVSNFI